MRKGNKKSAPTEAAAVAGGAAAAHPRPAPVQIGHPHGRALHSVARALDAPLAGALLARPPPRHPRPRGVDPRVPGAARPAAHRPVLFLVSDRRRGAPARRLPPHPGLRRRLLRRRPPRGLRLLQHRRLSFQAPPPARRPLPLAAHPQGHSRRPLQALLRSLQHLLCPGGEVISLHGVTLSDNTVHNLVAASPLLRTLELCYCDGLQFVSVLAAGAQLRSLTIAKCRWVKDVSTMKASSLRSFRYSGSYIRAMRIPATCALADLYICFGGPAGRGRDRPSTPYTLLFNWPAEVPRNWLQALANFSNLAVLTLCSSALRRVSAKARERSLPCTLQNLRELQLLMFAMYDSSLDDIYVFIVACCLPLLERLFVELPTNSHYYRPDLEPPESEDELLEPVEELPWKEPPEDEPEEELSEEEVDLQEELAEGEASEEKQSDDDWSDEELSDGGQSEEEPLDDCLENLKLLKMTNFKGGDNEMNLVRFVLRNSPTLNQLLLFTSKSDKPEWLQKNDVDTSNILEKLSPLKRPGQMLR